MMPCSFIIHFQCAEHQSHLYSWPISIYDREAEAMLKYVYGQM